ncbi:MAG: hypothetical protein NTU53_10185 [Planctomycetota bacterium]|nr:hypothetical protein [Planctomycetota bacterium]
MDKFAPPARIIGPSNSPHPVVSSIARYYSTMSPLPPRLRPLLLPVFLLLTLALTLLLAYALQSHLQHQQQVQLSPPQNLGLFILRPPRSWLARSSPDALILEEPPSRSRLRRRIEISLARSPAFLSPLEYLARTGDLPLKDASALLSTQPSSTPLPSIQRITIANSPAILISQTRLFRSPNHQTPYQSRQILAATLLPSNHAILLRLEGPGPATTADESLLKRVAESLALPDQPPIASAPQLELATDIRLTLPTNLQSFPTNDRFHASRTFIAADSPGYLAVNLTPVLSLSKEPAADLLSMLMVRDPAFHPTPVRQLDSNTFCCLRRPEDIFPAIAYLRVNPDGRALLAEFRWNTPGSSSAADIAFVNSLWQQIATGLQFPTDTQIQSLLHAGSAALKQLPTDLATLLPTTPPNPDRWQWYDDALPRTAFSAAEYTLDSTTIFASHDIDRSPLSSGFARELSNWQLARDGSAYTYAYTYATIRAASTTVLSQETHLTKRKLTSIVRQDAESLAQATGPATNLYIPGLILPLALGRLPFQPMILQTESIPSPDPLASALPLLIFLEPAFDEPRSLPDEKEPMRCWSVRIIANGLSSRWYYDTQGRLESITFAGGLHGRRLDPLLPDTAPAEQTGNNE